MLGIKPQLQHKGGEDVSSFVTQWPGTLTHSKWRTGCLGWTQHGPRRAHEKCIESLCCVVGHMRVSAWLLMVTWLLFCKAIILICKFAASSHAINPIKQPLVNWMLMDWSRKDPFTLTSIRRSVPRVSGRGSTDVNHGEMTCFSPVYSKCDPSL